MKTVKKAKGRKPRVLAQRSGTITAIVAGDNVVGAAVPPGRIRVTAEYTAVDGRPGEMSFNLPLSGAPLVWVGRKILMTMAAND